MALSFALTRHVVWATVSFTIVTGAEAVAAEAVKEPVQVYHLPADETHNRFSSTIPPRLRVPTGAVIIAETRESSDGQVTPGTISSELAMMDLDKVHPLTGPVYVEGAEPGDTLAVTLLGVETLGWGWTAIFPGFGALPERFSAPYIRTFKFEDKQTIRFNERIVIPQRPFPGIMGVAPATSQLLSTMPPRENGGNMDDPGIGVGTTVYFPIFVEGALFSLGDGHAVQGRGEVGGPAIETPLRVTFKVDVVKGRKAMTEPQYENETYFAVLASDTTLDGAARKATGYMVDRLIADHGLVPEDAYVLCTLAGDLVVNEIPNKPHVSVTMRMRKDIFMANGK